jgi:hypothetical protein
MSQEIGREIGGEHCDADKEFSKIAGADRIAGLGARTHQAGRDNGAPASADPLDQAATKSDQALVRGGQDPWCDARDAAPDDETANQEQV